MNVCVLRPPLTFPEIRTATGLLISENVFTITQTTHAAAAAAADVPAASVDIGGGACGDGGAVGGGAAEDADPRLDSGACAACSSGLRFGLGLRLCPHLPVDGIIFVCCLRSPTSFITRTM